MDNKVKWTEELFNQKRDFVRSLGIKSRAKYFLYLKVDNTLPKRPEHFVWWVSWSDWLGTSNRFYGHNMFMNYDESKKFLSDLDISTKKEWEKYYKDNNIVNIPRCPDKAYKGKGWVSWSDWFGKKSRTDRNYENYEKFIEILNMLNIHSKAKYLSVYKNYNLPLFPLDYYNINSWTDVLPKKVIIRDKKSYSDSKKIIHSLNLKSQKDWFRYCKSNKIPKDIPKTPDKYYDEWISWNDWLGHNNTTHKNYISYNDAKSHIESIGLTSLQEYYDYVVNNKIDFLPLQPSSYYSGEYTSAEDFLGYSEKISYGEKKIKSHLENLGIAYNHQHKFNGCRNINLLIFDFFIADLGICIEFDGRQHYEPIPFFGGQEGYIKRRTNDEIKNNFCISNNMKLLRISYEDINIVEKIIDKFLSIL